MFNVIIMMMEEKYIEVGSVSEFVSKITYKTNKNNSLKIIKNFDRKKFSLFFRGQAARYKIDNKFVNILESAYPSIFREKVHINNEHRMFKEFVLRNPDDFKEDKSTFEKLVRMQQYGLPTRLLDITSNALVALYMACSIQHYDCNKEFAENEYIMSNQYKDRNDGFVIVLKIKKDKVKYYDSDTVSVLSNISRRPPKQDDRKGLDFTDYKSYYNYCNKEKDYINISNEKKRELKIFNDYEPIQYLLHEIKEEKPYFQDYILEKHMHDIVCVKPLLNNRRIVRQDGAFLLFGMGNTKEEYPKISEMKEGIESGIIKINWRKKQEILDQLADLGITDDKVYPEMENVAIYLKKEFSKGSM